MRSNRLNEILERLQRFGPNEIAKSNVEEIKEILHFAKDYENIRSAFFAALKIQSIPKRYSGLLVVAVKFPNLLTDIFEIIKIHPELLNIFIEALKLQNENKLSCLYYIIQKEPNILIELISLAKNNPASKEALIQAFQMPDDTGVTPYMMLQLSSPELAPQIDEFLGFDNVAQEHLIKQLIKYIRKTENSEFSYDEEGVCRGLSTVYSYMAATRKLAWWKNLSIAISRWNGSEDALMQKIFLPDSTTEEGETVNILFKRALNYIFYNQATSNSNPNMEGMAQTTFLLPNVGQFVSEKGAIKFHEVIAGKMTSNELNILINENIFTHEGIFLIETVDHSCSIRYENGAWYFYDPNSSTGELSFDNKKALIEDIQHVLGNVLSLTIASWKSPDTQFKNFLSEIQHQLIKPSLLDNDSLSIIAKLAPSELLQLIEMKKEFSVEPNHLSLILKTNPQNIIEILRLLGQDYLRNTFSDINKLNTLLNCSSLSSVADETIILFLDTLGSDFFRNIIKSADDFIKITSALSDTQKTKFCEILGDDYIKQYNTESNNLIANLRSKPKDQIQILKSLGSENLKKAITNENQFCNVLSTLYFSQNPEQSFSLILEMLGHDFLKNITNTHESFSKVAAFLSNRALDKLSEMLGAAHINNLISDADSLAAMYVNFDLNVSNLRKSIDEMRGLLGIDYHALEIDHRSYSTLIRILIPYFDKEKFNNIITDSEILQFLFLDQLLENEKLPFLKKLDTYKLKELITGVDKNDSKLHTFIKQIIDEQSVTHAGLFAERKQVVDTVKTEPDRSTTYNKNQGK